MADLSPAAQAVMDAAFSVYDCEALYSLTEEQHASMIAAAALRALADQVASPIPDDCTVDVFNRQLEIRAKIRAIATELEAQANHSPGATKMVPLNADLAMHGRGCYLSQIRRALEALGDD